MQLDDVDRRLVEALRKDARLSMRELAKLVGVSTPTASARVKRLEALGIIRGYHAAIDPAVPVDAAPAAPTLATKIACHECGGPIHGPGVHKRFLEDGEREHWFCCANCASQFGARLATLARKR